jgi:hypothetical protein
VGWGGTIGTIDYFNKFEKVGTRMKVLLKNKNQPTLRITTH